MICPSANRARAAEQIGGTLTGTYAKGNLLLCAGGGYTHGDPADTGGPGWGNTELRGTFDAASQFGATLAEMFDGTSNTAIVSEGLIFESDADSRGCWARANCAVFSGHSVAIDMNTTTGQLGLTTDDVNTPNIGAVLPDGTVVTNHIDQPVWCEVNAKEDTTCGTAATNLIIGVAGVAARSRHPAGCNVGLGDASVTFVKSEVDASAWRNALTIMGKEGTTLP